MADKQDEKQVPLLRNPAVIVAIIGLLGTIIAAGISVLPEILPLVNSPPPAATATIAPTETETDQTMLTEARTQTIVTSVVPERTYPCKATINSQGLSRTLNVLREAPNFNARILERSVEVGEMLQVQAASQASNSNIVWYQITDLDDKFLGWISSEFLQLSDECPL